MVPRYGKAPKGRRAFGKAPRNWGKNVTLIPSITTKGVGPSMSIQGSSDTESFGLYVRNVLAPRLRSGQIVRPYGQPIRAHKAGWVRDLIEQKGCQLWLLPSYSPDLNPIEEAFSKVKNLIRKAKARTLEALFAVTARALEAVSEEDPRCYFDDCGYDASRD